MKRTRKIAIIGIAALLIAAAAIGAVLFETPQKGTIVEAPEVAEPSEEIASAPAVEEDPQATTTEDAGPEEPETDQAEVDETPEPVAPKFDVVRIDVDGSTVVAGQAAPGATVEILLDGDVIATETADGAGQFVSLFTVTVTGEPRQLVLRAAGGEVETELAAVEAVPGETEEDLADAASGQTGSATVEVATEPDDTQVAAVSGDSEAPEDVAGTQQEGAADPGLEGSDNQDPSSSTEEGSSETEDTVEASRNVEETSSETVESAPVLILPGASDDTAPTLVQPEADELALLQPASEESRASVRLDRISYTAGGDVDLLGRATPGNTVRIYANALFAVETNVVSAGQWQVSLPAQTGQATQLLRFDEVDASGKVVSRIETPFSYQLDDGPKTLQERRVEIEKGDHLWRIAEQYYGEGLRYSLIFSANADLIKDPDLIYPGQVFTVPQLVDGE
ncbi:MAG: LysM peptidoglycan-binding domain-containing protein [Pseudomonadota bacterium]